MPAIAPFQALRGYCEIKCGDEISCKIMEGHLNVITNTIAYNVDLLSAEIECKLAESLEALDGHEAPIG